jgi:Tfp pilus assembly protein PilN
MEEQPSIIAQTLARPPSSARQKGRLGAFVVIGAALLLLTLLFGGAVFFYHQTLARQLVVLQQSFERAEAEFEPALVAELTRTSRAIDTAKTLVGQHASFSNVLSFLEEYTLPSVRFTTFSFSADTLSLVLNGEARSYSELSQQSAVFESYPMAERVELSNLALLNAGRVGFAMQIIFKPAILQF